MLGLSLRDAAIRQAGLVPQSPTPPPAPSYLPALTTPGATYVAVASTERLIGSYQGPLVNAGGQDFAGVRVSPSEVQAARGGTDAIRVATLYDQTGGGKHYQQATPTQRFALSDLVQTRGALPIIIDGRRAGSPPALFRTMSAAASVAARAFTRAVVIEPTNSIIPQLLTSQGEGSSAHHLFAQPGYNKGNVVESTSGSNFGNKIPSSPIVLIHRERSDGQDVFFGGVKVTQTAVPGAGTLALRLGGVAGLEDFTPNLRLLADVVVSGALSDADCAALDLALRQRFGLEAWARNARILLIGDSIAEGVLSTLTRGLDFYVRPLLGEATDWWGVAVGGKTLAQCYADRADFEGQIPPPDTGKPIIAVIQGGINDVLTQTANLYRNVTTPYVSYLKSQGKKVVVCTLLPQTAVPDPAREQLRQDYNMLVRANAAGADIVCDLAAHATMGAYPAAPNNPALYPDAIHPSSLGYSHLGTVLAAAITPLLASA